MPVSALFSSIEQAKEYVKWNNRAQELAEKHLPGALTVILPTKESVDIFVTPEEGNYSRPSLPTEATGEAGAKVGPSTVGCRISSHPLAQSLVEAFGSPMSTTSANIHGKPEVYSTEELANQLENQEYTPDLVIDSGDLPRNASSTIVRIEGDAIEVLREGGIKVS